MNSEELRRRLDEAGIRQDAYQFGDGLPSERLVLARQGDEWVVFYSERGEQTGLRKFVDEEEANDYFFHTLDRMPEAHELG